MKSSFRFRRLAAVLLVCGLPVQAAAPSSPTWGIEFTFDVLGQERFSGVDGAPAYQSFYHYSGEVPGVNSGGDVSVDDMRYQSSGGTVLSLSNPSASVSNTTLKTRAQIEGALTPTVLSGPTCHRTPWIPGGVTCSSQPLEDANWLNYSFTSSVTALLNDSVIATHATAPVSGFRLALTIDGVDTRYLDTFLANAAIGGTGGGYELGYMLHSTFLNVQAGQTLYDGTYRLDGSDLPLNFNPTLPSTDTQRGRTVVSPLIPVVAGESAPISLELTSLVKISVTNLDSGRVLFLLESDYGSTVHVGFEVYDTAGRLLPDATVTGLDGARYTVMTTAVPEPATMALMLAGIGILGAAARKQRAALPASAAPVAA